MSRGDGMAAFLIHYELLQKPDVEYPALIPTLERLGAKRLTGSAWALRAELRAADVRDEIQLSALQGDRFVVAEVSDRRTIGTLRRIEDV
jgi:hypothetical protein